MKRWVGLLLGVLCLAGPAEATSIVAMRVNETLTLAADSMVTRLGGTPPGIACKIYQAARVFRGDRRHSGGLWLRHTKGRCYHL